MTNNHVVAGSSGARVRLSDGHDAAARLVGVSPAHDLAVLKIDVSTPAPPLRIGVSGVAILRVVPGSAAEAADLRGVRIQDNGTITTGDIILAIDGTPVDKVVRLLNRLDEHQVGDVVRLTLWRDGQNREVRVTLEGGGQ